VNRAGIFRLRLAVETQGDMAQLAQVLLGDVADGGHGIARSPSSSWRPASAPVQLAVAVNKAKLFDIRRRAFAEGDQHLVAQRIAALWPMRVMVVW
jgi:hypothetical protein